MSVSWRCPYCERHWPGTDRYALCPCCREPTKRSQNAAMGHGEAEAQAHEFEFGWWLWDNGRL